MTGPTQRSIAHQFAEAIDTLERTGSTDQLVAVYTADCTLGNVLTGEAFRGHDGVHEFWTNYATELGDAQSRFAVVATGDDGAVLEWTTEIRGSAGTDEYRGATVLELRDGDVVRSMAYFDPARLARLLDDVDAPSSGDDADGDRRTGDAEARQGWSGPSEPGHEPTTDST